MRMRYMLIFLFLLLPSIAGAQEIRMGQSYVPYASADSAYLFVYSSGKNKDHNGLHFAWSQDCITWIEIGPEHSFVKSDYGNWGPQKRMLEPSIRSLADGTWEAIWRVNEKEQVVARCTTPDLVHWHPQDYFNGHLGDFFTQPKSEALLPTAGRRVLGEIHRVSWSLIQGLIDEAQRAQRQAIADGERITGDGRKFSKLKPQKLSVTLLPEGKKQISDKLIGIFFEDINYAADGGLYAELVQNRDFEYHPRDYRFRLPEWDSDYAWEVRGNGVKLKIDSLDPIHQHNSHYAVLTYDPTLGDGDFSNLGYDGIVIRAGEQYDLSLYSRLAEGNKGSLRISLEGKNGEILASTFVTPGRKGWKKQSHLLRANASSDSARLVITPLHAATYHLDMVSLFPKATFKGRKNGMRRDLAQLLADMHPRFVRFPGGCVAHGDGLDNLYRWKNSIGPLEARVPNWNIWKYHQSLGLGFYEYFLFCEDIGAEPLPVIAAAVPCQNSCVGGYGQQGGLPMEQMEAYIQDILDLVEWANGDPKTSRWAKMRADAGHPEPFHLKYIGIGNEDLISDVFKERFAMIYNVLSKRLPEDITLIGTVGPSSDGSDYEEGWRFAHQLGLPMVDEHYYRSPGWFMDHQDYYDRYARGGTRVYLGEYAAHIPGRTNCLETALAEAMHLCNVERNGDVVAMTSYAPLLARKGHTQWNPDLIYFTGADVMPTTGYQVQKLFGQHAGDYYIPSVSILETPNADVQRRIVTSVVEEEQSGDLIIKCVNMLPVTTSFELLFPESAEWEVSFSNVLTGKLGDTQIVPTEISSEINNSSLKAELPSYAFVVFRIRKINQR